MCAWWDYIGAELRLERQLGAQDPALRSTRPVSSSRAWSWPGAGPPSPPPTNSSHWLRAPVTSRTSGVSASSFFSRSFDRLAGCSSVLSGLLSTNKLCRGDAPFFSGLGTRHLVAGRVQPAASRHWPLALALLVVPPAGERGAGAGRGEGRPSPLRAPPSVRVERGAPPGVKYMHAAHIPYAMCAIYIESASVSGWPYVLLWGKGLCVGVFLPPQQHAAAAAPPPPSRLPWGLEMTSPRFCESEEEPEGESEEHQQGFDLAYQPRSEQHGARRRRWP
jgi:hypothetical protein